MVSENRTTHGFLEGMDSGTIFHTYHDSGGSWHENTICPEIYTSADDFILRIFCPGRLIWSRSREIDAEINSLLSYPAEDFEIHCPADRDFFTITEKATGARININTSDKLRTWDCDAVDSPTLDRVFTRYQERLQIKFGFNRGQQGRYLIERLRKRVGRKNGQTDPALIVPQGGVAPFSENMADLYFFRPLTKAERRKKFLLAVDRNTAYLTACSVKLGLVDYEHCIRPDFEGRPGLYSITPLYDSNPAVPGELAPDKPQLIIPSRPGWYYAPVLRWLDELNMPYEIHEAYIWKHHSAWLDSWARELRDEIGRLDGEAQTTGIWAEDRLLRKLIKTTGVAAIGSFGSKPGAGDPRWYYRPDVRNTIITESSMRIYWDLHQAAMDGCYVAAIYNDCLYFVCDEDELKLHPFLTADKLSRKYKLDGVFDISSRKAKALFDSEHKNLPSEIKHYRL